MDNNIVQNQQNITPEPAKRGGRKRTAGILAAGIAIGVAASLLAVTILTGGNLQSVVGGGKLLDSSAVRKLNTLTNLIDSSYYEADEVTEDQLQQGLYKGLVESLDDPYSVYYTADEVKDLNESISGTFSGIGAYVARDAESGYPKIAGVIPDTPADRAGLQADDIIYKVDGESMQDVDLDVAVSKIRGEEGSSVHLTIARSGEADYLEMDITRESIDSQTVDGRMEDADAKIGYIQITEFDDVTADQFIPELQDLQKKGMKALVLDLRNNPGGTVEAVTKIAEYLIPKGLVFYMEYPDGKREEYSADGENTIGIPIAVLVNGNSASASEILSSSIQDSGAGKVIGTQTYGKGVVQTVYSLNDGTAVKLTIAHYYTRNGNDINKVGVTPDIEVEFDAEAYQKNGTDNQLERAVTELKQEMRQ